MITTAREFALPYDKAKHTLHEADYMAGAEDLTTIFADIDWLDEMLDQITARPEEIETQADAIVGGLSNLVIAGLEAHIAELESRIGEYNERDLVSSFSVEDTIAAVVIQSGKNKVAEMREQFDALRQTYQSNRLKAWVKVEKQL